MLCADVRAPAHTHHTSMPERNHIDDHSFHGHVTSKPVLDGLLPVHPPSFLVLRECGQGRVILPLVVGHSSQAALTDKPATLRASTLMMRKYSKLAMRPSTEVVISSIGACGARPRFRALGPLHQRPHTRTRDRPAAVARNFRLNSDSANDPCCSAQSWTLEHLRNRVVGTGPPGPGTPDPGLRARMRQRHTARTQRPHGQTPEDTLAHPVRSRIARGRSTRPRQHTP